VNVLRKLRAHVRLWFGFCPACNSEAPEMDTCPVCGGYRWADEGPPTEYAKREWWARYVKFLSGLA